MITKDVLYTTYEVTVTKNGREAVLVTYHVSVFGGIKEWLFHGDKLSAWWSVRSREQLPSDVHEVVRLCNIGKVLPTGSVTFDRDGRWYKVLSTKPKPWPKSVTDLMKAVREIDPSVEVVRVIG